MIGSASGTRYTRLPDRWNRNKVETCGLTSLISSSTLSPGHHTTPTPTTSHWQCISNRCSIAMRYRSNTDNNEVQKGAICRQKNARSPPNAEQLCKPQYAARIEWCCICTWRQRWYLNPLQGDIFDVECAIDDHDDISCRRMWWIDES
jgi:hypothetical protein